MRKALFCCLMFLAVAYVQGQDYHEMLAEAGVEVVELSEFEALMQSGGESTLVINFWATWCGPCIRELPYFDELHQEYSEKGVRVLLVSLDKTTGTHFKLPDFLAKRTLASEVLLLDEDSPHKFIDEIAPEWTGSIPATLIINSSKSVNIFRESELDYEALKTLVEPIIRTP